MAKQSNIDIYIYMDISINDLPISHTPAPPPYLADVIYICRLPGSLPRMCVCAQRFSQIRGWRPNLKRATVGVKQTKKQKQQVRLFRLLKPVNPSNKSLINKKRYETFVNV